MASTTFTKTISLMAYENKFTKTDVTDYYLRVKTQAKSLDIEAIAKEVSKQHPLYAHNDIRSILEDSFNVISDAVASGFIVNLPIGMFQAKAKGAVSKNDLSKAPDRSKIKVTCYFKQGTVMRNALNQTVCQIFTLPAPVGPLLNGVVNTRSVTDDNGVVTRAPLAPGEMCVLTGKNIKLAGEHPTVGILLTSEADATKTIFISPDRVEPNEPMRLQFVLPADITDGDWKVEVTTQYGSGRRTVISPRSYLMETPLVVGDGGGSGDVEDPTV